ncbi:hypothetical protein [Brevibacterium sandarakinum]|uniref:hypothetical protein n=1 Tax=Brevibacterium sandarakinum TaxID=629680 RepID=UPI002650F176|nr:hypothetical protein [Brevibacterium sandarakinum]MDN5659009.1 hypothetical protein [Brevibacterium sandarakinum]
MTRLTLVGSTDQEAPPGEPRDVFMTQYQEARDQVVTLLERLGDPIMTGILHSGGKVNRQVMVAAREHAQRGPPQLSVVVS